jgi:type II secretion system protein I
MIAMQVTYSRGKSAKRSPPDPRDGFSLLELILALAILSGAMAILGEAYRSGMRFAQYTRDVTQAQILCESKLAEIAAGLTPAESQDSVPCETAEEGVESEWVYSVEVGTLDESGLIQVQVTVTKLVRAGKRPVEFPLTRWMVDPSIETTEAPTSAGSATSDSASGGTL